MSARDVHPAPPRSHRHARLLRFAQPSCTARRAQQPGEAPACFHPRGVGLRIPPFLRPTLLPAGGWPPVRSGRVKYGAKMFPPRPAHQRAAATTSCSPTPSSAPSLLGGWSSSLGPPPDPSGRHQPWVWPTLVLSLTTWFTLYTGVSLALGSRLSALGNTRPSASSSPPRSARLSQTGDMPRRAAVSESHRSSHKPNVMRIGRGREGSTAPRRRMGIGTRDMRELRLPVFDRARWRWRAPPRRTDDQLNSPWRSAPLMVQQCSCAHPS